MQNSGVLLFTRLRHRVRAVEQEDCNLLVGLPANIHGTVNTVGWLALWKDADADILTVKEANAKYARLQ